MKLTSPGGVAVVAVILLGALALVDALWLRPWAQSQRSDMLRQEVIRAEGRVRGSLLDLQRDVLKLCCQASSAPEALSAATGDDQAIQTLGRWTFAPAGISWAWIAEPSGRILRFWSAEPRLGAQPDQQSIAAGIGKMSDDNRISPDGMLVIRQGIAIFARQPVLEAASGQVKGELWLARLVDPQLLGQLSKGYADDLVFVRGERLPAGVIQDSTPTHSAWPAGDGRWMLAWPALDAAGREQGYFRMGVPTAHIEHQADAARRTVLLVLSTASALVVLLVCLAHVLLGRPVARLSRMLGDLDEGKVSVEELSGQLAQEPLALSRKLAQAMGKLSMLSKTDLLTSLANRRHFEEVLDAFYNQSRRYNRPLSLIVLDIDFFKAVNDTGGHEAGDELLKIVARAIHGACRRADLPARIGGDEFSILLPETSGQDAAGVAQRIRAVVGSQPVKLGKIEMNITLSVGVADLDCGDLADAHDLVKLADKALYAAKERGRDRVVIASELVATPVAASPENRDVNVLCRKLAGLDNRFRGLFLKAVEEIMHILEQRNPLMAEHARRVQKYAVLLGREMGLSDRLLKRIQIAAMLQDIGMVAMPDTVLLAPGQLDDSSLALMRRHPLLSVRIMEGMGFLDEEIPAVRHHHERYDGKGYPEGLCGGSIPLASRILAVADAFDAMTSARTFRGARDRTAAVAELSRGAGTQFDPSVVTAFVAVSSRMGDNLLTVSEDEVLLDASAEGDRQDDPAGEPAATNS